MKNRNTAINTHNIFVIVCFALFVMLAVESVIEGKIWFTVFFGIICLLSVFGLAVSPLYYIFDEKAVTIVYFFGLRETISWSSIKEIYKTVSRGGAYPRYVLCYPHEKQTFFMVGEISKTRKTTELIKHYYGKI